MSSEIEALKAELQRVKAEAFDYVRDAVRWRYIRRHLYLDGCSYRFAGPLYGKQDETLEDTVDRRIENG